MKQLLILIAALLVSHICSSQLSRPEIYKCTEMKDGVYMSFNEFASNSPSIRKFKITKQKDLYFRPFMLDSTNQPAFIPGNVWGFCDGLSVFINGQLTSPGFEKDSDINDYRYLELDYPYTVVHVLPLYVLDLRTGKVLCVHDPYKKKSNIKDFMKDAPHLLKDYKEEKKEEGMHPVMIRSELITNYNEYLRGLE